MAAEQVRNCGGWMIVASRDSSIASLVETGRKFQRMFLKVRERMIAVHPMTQMLEEPPWRIEAGKRLGVPDSVQFILRVGYLQKYPDPVSLRMPVSWFIKA
jgi:hypothetical protein